MHLTPKAGRRKPGAPPGTRLDQCAFAGLCAFVVALASGGDTVVVGGTTIANWIALVPGVFWALRVALVQKLRNWSPIHFALLLFVMWAGASLLWSIDPEMSVVRIGTYASLLLFVVLLWELATTRPRVLMLLASYVGGAGIASGMTIANYLAGRETASQDLAALGVNADELGLMIALSVPIALYLLIVSQSRLLRGMLWIHSITSVTAILLTARRGAAITAAVGIALMMGPVLVRMSLLQRGTVAVVCVILIGTGLYFVPPESLERLAGTGTELTQGTLTHRTQIWGAGVEAFRDHPFLGVGSGGYGKATVRLSGISTVAHNSLLSVLVELGVVGAMLFGMVLASLFFAARSLPRPDRYLWITVLAAWTIGASSVTWEYRKTTWLLFGLLAAHAYARTKTAAPAVVRAAPNLPGRTRMAPVWSGSGALPASRSEW